MLTVTVSGSFHRHLAAIYTAVGEFRAVGVTVLSPSDPRIVDHLGEFLFVASDRVRSIRLVQDRHLQCIGASSFLWLVAPDGYVGPSASMEIGYAIAARTPIVSDATPADATLSRYVKVVPSIKHAVAKAKARLQETGISNVLIDPTTSIHEAIARLDHLNDAFANATGSAAHIAEEELKATKRFLAKAFDL
jgi:hypothetical protein